MVAIHGFPDLVRIPSEDGKRSGDRFRCTACIDYGSDDESRSFTHNNKSAHLRTAKHRAALDLRVRRLEEEELGRTQGRQTSSPPTEAGLLPLPKMSSDIPTAQVDGNTNVFENFRRHGLEYLDENGERLEFSAGTALDDERCSQGKETRAEISERLDSESDVDDLRAELVMQENGPRDFWPYPSKTVSITILAEQRKFCNIITDFSDISVGRS